MNNDVYADLLRIAIRATGDFRFPDLAPPDDTEEEIGFLVYGSNDWNQAEIRQSLRQLTYGIEVKRITDTYEDTSAGADAAFLSFLVEVGLPFLTGLGTEATTGVIKGAIGRNREKRGERAAARFEESDYERTALDAICSRFGLQRDQIQIDSIEHGVDGKGSVEASLPPDDGRRFSVSIELHGDGLRYYKMKRINPDRRDEQG